MAKLNELFEVTYGNKYDLNKMLLLPRHAGGVSFVGRAEGNHGVSATVRTVNGVEPYPAGLITVALGGSRLLCSFVQEYPFYTAQNVAVLKPKIPLTFSQKLYVCLCIRANRFRYGAFGREANRTLRTLEIPSLESFPSWVQSVTKGSSALDDIGSALEAVAALSSDRLARKRQGDDMVTVSDLFSVVYGSNLELNRLERDEEGVNFVSRSGRNNGVTAKVKRLPDFPPIAGGVLTVAGGGSVLETFYQAEPFYSGRDLYYLKPKLHMVPEEMLFYAQCIRANRYRYSYGRQANRTLKDIEIPAFHRIPKWVYGSCSRVVSELEGEGLIAFEAKPPLAAARSGLRSKTQRVRAT